MAPKKPNIRVIKVPLEPHERPVDRPKAFPRMPTLYLELIENKDKIKQHLVNQEYVSSYRGPNTGEAVVEEIIPPLPEYGGALPEGTEGIQIPENFEHQRHRDLSHRDSSHREISRRDREREIMIDDDDSEMSPIIIPDRSIESRENFGDLGSDAPSSEISNRLRQLMMEDQDGSDGHSVVSSDKYSRRRDKTQQPPARSIGQDPPTLAQLEQNGEYNTTRTMPNLGYGTEMDASEDEKRELLFKFDMLAKSYPNASIQEFTIHSDYATMQRVYDATLRRLSIDSSVESYKTYLIGGFALVEWVLGKYLNLDMQGFTQQQILSMNKYEQLLIELGEKSYVPDGSRWPVEIRLAGMVMMNAAMFIFMKMITNSTGMNAMGLMSGLSAPPPPAGGRKRKMRGPDIDLDDLPDIDNLPGEENDS